MIRACLSCEGEVPRERNAKALYCTDQCGSNFRNRKHYKSNPKKFKAKRDKENSWAENRMYVRVKSRAKLSGILFNLDVEDIVIPDYCPVLGMELKTASGHNQHKPNSPSLDKIIPELGYVKGNVRVISMRANHLKSNASVEELELVLEDLRSLLSKE